MKVEQYVMAYQAEQDRIRALLPAGFDSLRPVLRINAEIRDDDTAWLEFNTPVAAQGKRGWLNIGNWDGETIRFKREGHTVYFFASFVEISFVAVGIAGGCPAEKDNDGCFFLDDGVTFRPAEKISVNKEFCDCRFAWKFTDMDAHGKSQGKTLPAFPTQIRHRYEKRLLTAQNAAAIPCEQVLGAYVVKFER